jgi:4-hydroxy-tetrahydrodipicolinate synthase
MKAHVDRMLDAGVHIVLANGGTGEFPYLRWNERKELAELIGNHVAGRAVYMVQTSAVSTSETIEMTQHAKDIGADAAMVLPPYFEGPNMDGVYDHFEKVASAVDIPIMVYNIPQCSNIDITPDFFKRLLEIDNIEYIKDSTGDIVRIQELLRTGGTVFNGGDPITFQSLLAGCPGCVWGAVNAIPREAVELFNLVTTGKLAEANALWQRILPSQLFLWSHPYNPAVKAASQMMGHDIGQCRLPQQPLTDSEASALVSSLAPLLNVDANRKNVA